MKSRRPPPRGTRDWEPLRSKAPRSLHPTLVALNRLICEDCGYPSTTTLVGVALAKHLGANGRCFPRIQLLCSETRLKRTAVKAALRDLIKGPVPLFLRHGSGRRHKTPTYELIRDSAAFVAARDDARELRASSLPLVAQDPTDGTATKGDATGPQTQGLYPRSSEAEGDGRRPGEGRQATVPGSPGDPKRLTERQSEQRERGTRSQGDRIQRSAAPSERDPDSEGLETDGRGGVVGSEETPTEENFPQPSDRHHTETTASESNDEPTPEGFDALVAAMRAGLRVAPQPDKNPETSGEGS